ncbi:MAG: hypothetical protein ACLRFJ_04045, partial [Alphaproteobacteria bacterium]
NDSTFAEKIRAQKNAVNAATANTVNENAIQTYSNGTNSCDNDLRKCMQDKCGTDFTKCATDTDTLWGTKMDACRQKTKCSAHEYSLFSPEIKSDRNMNVQISSYNEIVDCGNQYNSCITKQCGNKFNKCLGKSASDRAISACAQIARDCTRADSGLASRFGNIFATLRTEAEKQVAIDEKRLYELRDQMRQQCNYLGAMFDERTFDCVYTINFFANNSETPYASKKAYAGSTFDCTPNWFGIDITTFKENAYRLTREQTAASSAMFGAGVGTAAGAITSGAIGRAIDSHNADRELKEAECVKANGEWNKLLGTCTSKAKLEKEKDRQETKEKNRKDCEAAGNTWFLGKCWEGKGTSDSNNQKNDSSAQTNDRQNSDTSKKDEAKQINVNTPVAAPVTNSAPVIYKEQTKKPDNTNQGSQENSFDQRSQNASATSTTSSDALKPDNKKAKNRKATQNNRKAKQTNTDTNDKQPAGDKTQTEKEKCENDVQSQGFSIWTFGITKADEMFMSFSSEYEQQVMKDTQLLNQYKTTILQQEIQKLETEELAQDATYTCYATGITTTNAHCKQGQTIKECSEELFQCESVTTADTAAMDKYIQALQEKICGNL